MRRRYSLMEGRYTQIGRPVLRAEMSPRRTSHRVVAGCMRRMPAASLTVINSSGECRNWKGRSRLEAFAAAQLFEFECENGNVLFIPPPPETDSFQLQREFPGRLTTITVEVRTRRL